MNHKFVLILSLFSTVSYAQLMHKYEIGYSHLNKNSEFIKDLDIKSPKSAFVKNNTLYVNSLEGLKTVVYSLPTFEKKDVIEHTFNTPNYQKLNNYSYSLYQKNVSGKPVEFSFNDTNNKLYVSYYRFDYDHSSSQGSAVAEIDINTNKVEKLLPAGSIPKILTTSHNNEILATTNWGDNTIGFYDLKNNYDYTNVIIGSKFNTHIGGDRDRNCGNCLRGSIFTKDDKYFIASKMSGSGLAVVDVDKKKYLGTIPNVPLTVRHMVLSKDNNWLYVSTMFSKEVAKIAMSKILREIELLENKQKYELLPSDWKSLKPGSGVRTIELSKDQKYIYAALNDTSELAVIDADSLKLISKYKAAPYPVGLTVSEDDRFIILTSQGKNGVGGNHLDVFERLDLAK